MPGPVHHIVTESSGIHGTAWLLMMTSILSVFLIIPAMGQQSTVYAGPVAGFAWGMIRTTFPVSNGCDDYGRFDNVTLNGQTFGVQMILPSLLGADVGGSIMIGYSLTDIRSVTVSAPIWIFDETTKHEQLLARKFTYDGSSAAFSLEASGLYRITDAFGLAVGFQLGYPLAFTSRVTQHLADSEGYAFGNGETSEERSDVTTPLFRSLALNGTTALYFDLSIGSRLMMRTRFAGTAGLSPFTQDRGLRDLRLNLSIGVHYSLFRSVPTVVEVPRVPSTSVPSLLQPPMIAEVIPPKRMNLTATIRMHGISERAMPDSIATVRVVETVTTTRTLSDSSVLETPTPIIRTNVRRHFNSPLVKLEPEYQAEAGMKQWTIVLSHGTDTIARYSSQASAEENVRHYDWQPVVEELAAETSRVTATFIVEDSADATVEAQSSIPLQLQRYQISLDHSTIPGTDEEQMIFLLPHYNDSAAEFGVSDAIMAQIQQLHPAKGRIEVLDISLHGPLVGNNAERLAESLRTGVAKTSLTGMEISTGITGIGLGEIGDVVVRVIMRR